MQDVGYDDVFGEINVLKFGIGWRTTPRSEGHLQFHVREERRRPRPNRHGGIGRHGAIERAVLRL
jgi:hypothetical protein